MIFLKKKHGVSCKFIKFFFDFFPVSLVNVNAKITCMCKVLVTRIKNVLPDIIHHNLRGFAEDHFIAETV